MTNQDEDPEVPAEKKLSLTDSAGPVVGAVVGELIGGPGGAAVGAGIGTLGQAALDRLVMSWTARRRANGERVLHGAAAYVGITPEDFVRGVNQIPKKQLLAGAAVTAGAGTVLEEKIVALARALADGVIAEDDARVDELIMVVQALADIEVPHLKVLDTMIRKNYAGTFAEPLVEPDFTDADWYQESRLLLWSDEAFEEEMPQLKPVFPALLGALERRGLIREQRAELGAALEDFQRELGRRSRASLPSKYREGWRLTALGLMTYGYLRAVGTAPETSDRPSSEEHRDGA